MCGIIEVRHCEAQTAGRVRIHFRSAFIFDASGEVLKDHQSIEQFVRPGQALNFHQTKILMRQKAGLFLVQPADKIVE